MGMDVNENRRKKRSSLRLYLAAAAVAGLFVFLMLVFVPAPCCNGDRADRLKRQANLRGVSGWVIGHVQSDSDGVFPEKEDYSLVLMAMSDVWPEPIFGSDETQDDIWMCPIPWPDRKLPSDITDE